MVAAKLKDQQAEAFYFPLRSRPCGIGQKVNLKIEDEQELDLQCNRTEANVSGRKR